jgi:hypothetical protein
MPWNYQREDSDRVTGGDHRFEIVSAEQKTSKTGREMIVVGLKINGSEVVVKDYIVDGPYFNKKATQLFDSTGIREGDFTLPGWVGAVGAARFKEDENGYLKVAYYLDQKRAERLPEWRGAVPERQTVTTLDDAATLDEEELPF